MLLTARPRYRRNVSPCSEDLDRKKSTDGDSINQNIGKAGNGSKLVSDRSRTLKWAIQQYKPMQVTKFQTLTSKQYMPFLTHLISFSSVFFLKFFF